MAANKKVLDYLNSNDIDYEVVEHPRVFTSIEEARALGIDADEIAKCLVINMRGEHALAVVPGDKRISNNKLRAALGNKHARLASEAEMKIDFPDWELGAVPPLGDLFGLPIYLDIDLVDHEILLFSAGTHTDSIKINSADFINLIRPDITELCEEEERWAA